MEARFDEVLECFRKLREKGELLKEVFDQVELDLVELKKEVCNQQEGRHSDDNDVNAELVEQIKLLKAQIEDQEEILKIIEESEEEKNQLVAKLEDLLAENEELSNKIQELESRIAVLEHIERIGIKNISEDFVKMPAPAPLDKETRRLKLMKDVARVKEIGENALKSPSDSPKFTKMLESKLSQRKVCLSATDSGENRQISATHENLKSQDVESDEYDSRSLGSKEVLYSRNSSMIANDLTTSFTIVIFIVNFFKQFKSMITFLSSQEFHWKTTSLRPWVS